ncbi:MAG: 2'-deoxycytidine 5'-triphosphate deaminase, partial [Pseudomonadota bacterium]
MGVLPSQTLEEMIAAGQITATPAVIPEQIQPASLDLRLGQKAYRVRASFLAGEGQKVADRLRDFVMHEVDLSAGAVLEKGCVYVVPLMESLALPMGLQAVANAKSSTGRLDLLTRTITDGGVEFDRIPEGYTGPLYAEICPRSFSVLVRPGMRLNQIRFRDGHATLSDTELSALHADTPLVNTDPIIADGLGFSVDLQPATDDLVGYRAKPYTGVMEIDILGHYVQRYFWEEFRNREVRIILVRCAFYIL